MSFDQHLNFAVSRIVAAPSPSTSGTSVTVTAGEGIRFPTPPFNATIWPVGVPPLDSNAEIVRVTAILGDDFTILRSQELTSAKSIATGYYIAATITAKTITDIEDQVTNSYYEKLLSSTFTDTIPVSEHGLTKVRGVNVLTPSGAEMEVYTEIRSTQEVYIESLINLTNHTLILF